MKFILRATELFLFLLPFQVALSPVSGVDLPVSRIVSIFLFLSLLALMLARRKLIVPLSVEVLFLGLFLFLSFLSVFWAQDVSWAVRRFLFLFSFFPLFPLYVTLFHEKPDAAARLCRALAAGAGLAALIAIVEFLSQYVFGVATVFRVWVSSVLPIFLGPSFAASVAQYPSLLVNIGGRTLLRASAFFPDPHMAAFFFGLSFPPAVWSCMNAKTTWGKYLFAFFASVIAIADLLTFSRGGYAGLGFGAAVFVWRYVFAGDASRWRRLAVVGAMIVVPIVLFSVAPLRERSASMFLVGEGSNMGRMDMYVQAIRNIGRQPYGYGLGNYPLAVKPTAEYREPIYAHDLFLDIATESGILGAFCFFAALYFVFRSLIRQQNGLLFAGAVSVAIFFGHALFEMPLYSVHVLPVVLLFLAFPSMRSTISAES
ncbi:MAG TPA: O-antigen ligase family protein [Candidatus Fimivivens sp.]|nr:O-antigen ligase family protein [Candidatus Fimivivens sp.]